MATRHWMERGPNSVYSIMLGWVRLPTRVLPLVRQVLIVGAVATCLTHSTCANDVGWPQFRGPAGTGQSMEANPPLQWSATENLRWKARIDGRGHSTPLVTEELVFLTTAIPTGDSFEPRYSGRPGAHDNLPVSQEHRFVAIALARDSGEVLWERELHRAVPVEGGHESASLASASPVTNGSYFYAFFGSHGLYCLNSSGKIVWQKQFGIAHSKHGHGEGASPTILENTLVINWDEEGESFIVAMDAKTGREIWKRKRSEVTSWSTPIIVAPDEQNGLSQSQVVVCGTERVRGYDLETGRVVWECGGMSANIVATPIYSEGIVYVGSSYEKRVMMAIRLSEARGDITSEPAVLWSRSRGTPYVPSMLLMGDKLYFLAHYQNIMTRIDGPSGRDAPGPMRLGPLSNIYASPVASARHLFVTDLRGTTAVIEDADVPRLVAINRIDEPVFATLALAGDDLLIRGERHVYCFSASR